MLLMLSMLLSTHPLGLDHTGSRRCALGYFRIWSLSNSLCFDEVATHQSTDKRDRLTEAGSGDAGLSRQMQTPPSSSSFFKKFRYKVALDAKHMLYSYSLYICFS